MQAEGAEGAGSCRLPVAVVSKPNSLLHLQAGLRQDSHPLPRPRGGQVYDMMKLGLPEGPDLYETYHLMIPGWRLSAE